MRPLPCRARALFAGAALAGLSLACFEQPVSESLYLRFLPGNSVVLGITVQLASDEAFKNNRAASERIEALRRDLLQGRDDWSRRLERLHPALERLVLDREAGRLQNLSRRCLLEDQAEVESFFSDTLVRAQITRGENDTQLTLIPGPGGRATRSQREELETRLRPWLAAYSRYLTATKALYDYLEPHPSRAGPCLGALFRGEIEKTGAEEGDPLTPEEKDLAEAAREAMDETLDLFTVPEQNPYSLEELSRLAYDPFPASVTIQVPGPLLEVEGFERQGTQVARVPEMSLWSALLAENDRWISPDPLQTQFQHLKHNRPLDLASFLSQARRASEPPTPEEIRRSLEKHLFPAALYQVRWSTRDLKELDPSEGVESLWAVPSAVRE